MMEDEIEDINDANIVNFMTYNLTGMKTVKAKWIVEICDENKVDYLSIQEHLKKYQKHRQILQ